MPCRVEQISSVLAAMYKTPSSISGMKPVKKSRKSVPVSEPTTNLVNDLLNTVNCSSSFLGLPAPTLPNNTSLTKSVLLPADTEVSLEITPTSLHTAVLTSAANLTLELPLTSGPSTTGPTPTTRSAPT